MLVSEKVTADKLKNVFEKLNLMENRDKQLKLVDILSEKFDMPGGEVNDYISGRLDVEKSGPFIQYIFCVGIDEIIGKDLTNQFFTEIEQEQFSKAKIKRNDIKFPIEISCLPVTDDQYIGVCDAQFLMALRTSQLINYNTNAQRTMTRVIHNGVESYELTVNKKAVREIVDSYEANGFIPNTITLNIPEDEFDYRYDDKNKQLIINSLNHFDISDGYHRYLAISQIYDKDHSFNYPMELRILHFSDDKAKRFIGQEDKKTKMRRVDSQSMDMNDPNNLVCERLNSDYMCNLSGMISRNKGIVSLPYLANMVRYFYYRNWSDKSKAGNMKYIITTEKDLRDKLNCVVTEIPEVLDHALSFEQLLIIMTNISTKESMPEAVAAIKRGFANIDQLSKSKFYGKNTKASQIKEIEKICA